MVNAFAMTTQLHVLSAGAAQGVVEIVQRDFMLRQGVPVRSQFGSVGAVRRLLLDRAPCDVLVTSEAALVALIEAGEFQPVMQSRLGAVQTGVAIRVGDPVPDTSTEGALRDSLLMSRGLFFADPLLATGGKHFVHVMHELGVAEQLADRLHPSPNGLTAMRAMASSEVPRPIGCTQVTEVALVPGLRVVGPLPGRLALTTGYTAAVNARCGNGELAHDLVSMLTGAESSGLRSAAGFR